MISVAVVLVVLLFIAKLTGAINYFRMSTTAMEPGIKLNKTVFTSNLVSADLYDRILFRRKDPLFGEVVWVYRICGVPGDTVEIRDGDLYVNGVNADRNLSLKKEYILSRKDATGFITEEHEDVYPTEAGDSLVATLVNNEVQEKGIPHQKIMAVRGQVDSAIYNAFHQPWNPDHFGPVKVPEGKYFLLGDNRHQSMDSRYIGFVDKKDWVGTILW